MNKDNPTVIHVSDSAKSGVAAVIEMAGEVLKNSQINFRVVVPSYHAAFADKNKLVWSDATWVRGSNKVLIIPGMIREVFNQGCRFGKGSVTLFHAHSILAAVSVLISFIFLKVKGFRPKLIYQPHGTSSDPWRQDRLRYLIVAIEWFILKHSFSVIVISDYEKRLLSKYCDLSKIAKVDSGAINSSRIPDTSILNTVNDRWLFVGRDDRQKGFDLLLAAWPKDGLLGTLYVVGDFTPRCNQEYVKFLGWKSREETFALMATMAGLIVPSRWEGLGLVAIEAISCGIPAFVSNRGGLPEIVKQGVTGLVFDLNDLEGFLHREEPLVFVSNMDKIAFSLGVSEIRNRYSKKNYSKQLLAAYYAALL